MTPLNRPPISTSKKNCITEPLHASPEAFVVPAEAGTQWRSYQRRWIPAFAGMTKCGRQSCSLLLRRHSVSYRRVQKRTQIRNSPDDRRHAVSMRDPEIRVDHRLVGAHLFRRAVADLLSIVED